MMRRLETREDIERKNKLRKSILTIIILLLLLVSTLGYAFLSNSNTSKNNPKDQTDKSDRISFSYQDMPINLISTYNDMENISVNITAILYDYSGKNLYISSKNQGILQEIGSTLGRLSPRVQEACYLSCVENLPEKNCSDNLIVWRESPINKVYQNESCIFIEGDIRSADAFLYRLFKPI